MRPIFVYDGNCSFCRFWMNRWRRHTGERVEYAAHQAVASRFPSIATEESVQAVRMIEANGTEYSGAAAVLRLWTYRSRVGHVGWWCYRHVPLYAPIT